MKKLFIISSLIILSGCNNSQGITTQPINQPNGNFQEPDIDQILKDKYSFDKLDANKDNSLNFSEFFSADKNDLILPPSESSKLRTFQDYDKNRDNYLTRQEYDLWKRDNMIP